MLRPKLRRLERVRMRRDDEALVVLRDPLELAEPFAIDAQFEPLLDALDGQRSVAQIRQSLMMRGVVSLDLDDLEDFVAELGEAGLLDDDRFRELWAKAHDAFVEEEVRAPRRAGLLYPDEPEALRSWLAPLFVSGGGSGVGSPGSGVATGAEERGPGYGARVRAVVVGHQPPPALASGLRPLLASLPPPESLRRVLILATDHAPGLMPYASADKDWATPLGTLACDLATLAKLDERVSWLLREQTRLRVSDPIEWASLTLAAAWGPRCPPILPIACGQTRLTTRDGAEAGQELIEVLGELLGDSIAAGETLVWTTAELFHVGPAYGQAELPGRAEVEARSRALVDAWDRGPAGLAKACMDSPAAWRPSGAAALVTLAELVPDAAVEILDLGVLAAAGEEPGWIACPTLGLT